MNRELERKFLVKKVPEDLDSHPSAAIDQGYLALEPDGVEVRLRKKGAKHYLTVKRGRGSARDEREVEITAEQFAALWPITAGRRLTKTRYDIAHGELTIELDVYSGNNTGLLTVEVEFPDEAAMAAFTPPDWFGEEISENRAYSNRNLAKE
jgi:CYTH domain-containing protein